MTEPRLTVTGRRGRWRELVAMTAVVLAVVVVPASAAPRPRRVPVVFHYRADHPKRWSHSCPSVAGASGAGLALDFAARNGVASGDTWVEHGAARDRICVNLFPDGMIHYTGSESGEVALKGCGTGAITYSYRGVMGTPDPTTGQRTDHATWSIVAHTARGGLKRVVRGGGTLIGKVNAAGTSATGKVIGSVLCRTHGHPPG